jgi:Flp pilus assembly protein TadD
MELNDAQIDYFNQLFEKATNDQDKLVYLGGFKMKSLGIFGRIKLKRSISSFKKCLEIVPDHWPSMFLMGKSYQRLGDHVAALAMMERAYKLESNNPSIPMEASLEAMHVGDVSKSIFYSEASLKLKPSDPGLMGNHAMNLLIAGKDPEAKAFINQALVIQPRDEINQNVYKIIDEVTSGKRARPTFRDVIH